MGFNSGFKGLISFQKCPDQLRHPPSFLFKGARGCLPGSKVDGACVYLSPPASAEVKKEWSYTSIHSTPLCGLYKDNFTLTSLFRKFDYEGNCLNNNTLKC